MWHINLTCGKPTRHMGGLTLHVANQVKSTRHMGGLTLHVANQLATWEDSPCACGKSTCHMGGTMPCTFLVMQIIHALWLHLKRQTRFEC